jgi:hypothetical protein
MQNLFKDSKSREFYVWIDPNNFMVQHNIKFTDSLFSMPINSLSNNPEGNLTFIPNPDYDGGFISPFQNNITCNIRSEYNLEINRLVNYPSRLNAVFLLDSKEEANLYKERHFNHVGNRILKKCVTEGEYIFSTHDSSWVDFLRLPHAIEPDSITLICEGYWFGTSASDCPLKSFGEPWSQERITEILFCGILKFPNKNLVEDDV